MNNFLSKNRERLETVVILAVLTVLNYVESANEYSLLVIGAGFLYLLHRYHRLYDAFQSFKAESNK